MKNNKENLIIGLIFILVGVLLILSNLNIIHFDFGYVLTSLGRLWPLVFVVIGLNLVIKNKTFNHLLWLVFVVIIFLYGFYLQEQSPMPFHNEITEMETISVPMEKKVSSGHISMDLGAMNFNVQSSNDPNNMATVNSDGKILNVDNAVEGSLQQINITSSNFSGKDFMNLYGSGGTRRLDVAVNEEMPWSFDIDSGAIAGTMHLENIALDNLNIDLGAADLKLYLGDKSSNATIDIDSGISTIEINVPKEAGLLIEYDSELNSTNLSQLDLIKRSEKEYISKNYEDASCKYHIIVDIGLSDFTINQNR